MIMSGLTVATPVSAGCDEPGERNNVQCRTNNGRNKTRSSNRSTYNCDEPGERNNVQCTISNKSKKGGKKNDSYQGGRKVRLTISDKGGSDQLRLSGVRLSDVRFRTKGKDLYLTFDRGSVRIRNHEGSGRIETIRFSGGDRIRFSNKRMVASGPTVASATKVDKGKDVEVEVDPRLRGGLDVDFKKGTVQFEFEAGLGVRGGLNLGQILSDVIDAIARAFRGDDGTKKGGGGGSDRDPCNCYDDGWNGGNGVIDDGDYNNNYSGI